MKTQNSDSVKDQNATCDNAVLAVCAFKGKIHKMVHSKDITNFYFTKNKNNCLMIEYDKSQDFGQHSTSGVWIRKIELHYNNSFVKKELIEINILEVPKSITDVLQYLR